MIIYPAIDIKGGKCVRLYKGDFNEVTVFNDDVVNQARQFEKLGFEYLHVVDLDGAVAGSSVNFKYIENIVKNTNLKVQVGGGIRNIDNVRKLLSIGVARVIIGTAALTDPEFVMQACKEFEGQIIVGIDGRGDKVAVQGWLKDSDVNIIDLAKKFEDVGVAAIIYTDIEKDGTLQGVSFDKTLKLAKSVNIDIIASGGVASIEDVKKIANCRDISGVIVGKAWYGGKITAKEIKIYLKN